MCQKWKLIGPVSLCFIPHVVNSVEVEGVRKCASIIALLPACWKNHKVSGVQMYGGGTLSVHFVIILASGYPIASSQQYLFDKCLLLYVKSRTPDDGRKDCPKHVECHSKIK